MDLAFDFGPARWVPHPDEGPFEYWASLSPMAPMFGVGWRFAPKPLGPVTAKPKAKSKPKPKVAPRIDPKADDAVVVAPVTQPASKTPPKSAAPKPTPVAKAAAAPVAEPAPAPKAAQTSKAKAKPKTAPKPKPRIDDLSVIKGIGPKMVEKLTAAGITSYAQIAGWSDADIARMDESLGGLPGAITRADWVGQAKVLAE